ncbi:MAG: hypothetical protein JNM98_18110, partial [Rhodocyclaceae bacterium]|nr:hypothetical protein [Rhodocyclaceae bacterium]
MGTIAAALARRSVSAEQAEAAIVAARAAVEADRRGEISARDSALQEL